jgi:Uma2 family endonuclease
MRVQANGEATAVCKCKPDIVVRCGPSENKICVTDPVVVIEVLSPATIDFDRGKKLMFYKTLATLHHIVLAYSDQRRVEHYFRDDDEWRFESLVAARDVLRLETLGFQIGLEDVYFDLAF